MESYKINIGKIPDSLTPIVETHTAIVDSFGNCYIQLEFNAEYIETVSVNSTNLAGFLAYKGHSNQPGNGEFTVFFDDDYCDAIYLNKEYIGKEIIVKYYGSKVSDFVEFNYKKITHGAGSIVMFNKLIDDSYTLRFIKRLNGQSFKSFNLYTELNKIKDINNKSIVSSGSMLNTCGQFIKSGELIEFEKFTNNGKYWVPSISATKNWTQYICDTFVEGKDIDFHGGGGCLTGSSRDSQVYHSYMYINNITYRVNTSQFMSSNCVIEPKNINIFMYMITL